MQNCDSIEALDHQQRNVLVYNLACRLISAEAPHLTTDVRKRLLTALRNAEHSIRSGAALPKQDTRRVLQVLRKSLLSYGMSRLDGRSDNSERYNRISRTSLAALLVQRCLSSPTHTESDTAFFVWGLGQLRDICPLTQILKLWLVTIGPPRVRRLWRVPHVPRVDLSKIPIDTPVAVNAKPHQIEVPFGTKPQKRSPPNLKPFGRLASIQSRNKAIAEQAARTDDANLKKRLAGHELHLACARGPFGVQEWNETRSAARDWDVYLEKPFLEFSNITFNRRSLSGVCLAWSTIERSAFKGCCVDDSDFKNAVLNGVEFTPMMQSHVGDHGRSFGDGEGCFGDYYFQNSSRPCRQATAPSHVTPRQNCTLNRADFSHSRLVDVDFTSADLKDAVFYECELVDCNFFDTNLVGVRGLETAKIKGIKGDAFVRFASSKWDGYFSWANIRAVGNLPLARISYAALTFIVAWSLLRDLTVSIIDRLTFAMSEKEFPPHWQSLFSSTTNPLIDFLTPDLSTRIAIVGIAATAVAATIYQCFCPRQVKTYTRDQWMYDAAQARVAYDSLCYQSPFARYASVTLYTVALLALLWRLLRVFFSVVQFTVGF